MMSYGKTLRVAEMRPQVKVVYPYNKLYTTDKNTVIMYSPRISGKTYPLAQLVYIYANKYPNHDMVLARANYNSLEDSLYNEILAFADSIGQSSFYTPFRAPLRITTAVGNTIYFKGIGGSDYSRTGQAEQPY